MKQKNIPFSVIVLLAFLVAACSEAEITVPEAPTVAPIATDATETPDAVAASPAWYAASLTDVRTGQPFSIESFSGKVVLVETMAIWCPKCLEQQKQVIVLHEMLGERDDFISIGLDVDLNEDTASLKGYVESNGFTWLYAVSSADVSREIASLYGDQFLNPPATAMLVIDRHGVAHPLPFGIKSANELLQAVQPFLNESE